MRNTKILLTVFASVLFTLSTFAQSAPEDWQHLSFDEAGIYGVESNKAYEELLKGKKSEKVIVAVIDSGTDIDHEDLKDVLWTNKGEIPGNGIDDDGNGYIDDVHGWSFLGGKDYDVYEETLELTRIYARYTKKFEGMDPKKINRKEYKKYQEIKKAFLEAKESTEKQYEEFNNMFNQISRNYNLLAAYLDNPSFKFEDLNKIASEDSIVLNGKMAFAMFLQRDTAMTADTFHENVMNRKSGGDAFFNERLNFNYNEDWNPREGKGYNEADFKNFKYGNNTYLVGGSDNGHGTHCAGIIGATRNNETGMNGIADNIEIMTIRTVPNGDEHDRDVAAAMRYAVDNGAKVISMSYGKAYSYNKEEVDKAIKYGVKKGVLFVHAAGNDSKNIDEEDNFPNVKNSKSNAKAWIEVGASSWHADENLPAKFSNYGKKTVDLFAPGVDIYSTVPMSDYAKYSGTSMACPAVAGVAATVMSYYPELSAKEVKKVLMESVTDLSDMEVVIPNSKRSSDAKKVKFGELSKTGGIVNLYKALQLAEKMSK